MRKFLTILFIVASLSLFSQALNEANYYRVANSSTAFGKNIPVGTLIYDVGADALYEITAAALSTATLTTATKTEIGGVTNYWQKTGTDLYPTTTGDNILMDDNATITTIDDGLGESATASSIIMKNTTASTSSVMQNSPALELQGTGWNSTGTVSEVTKVRLYNKPIERTTTLDDYPTSVFAISSNTNDGAFEDMLQVGYDPTYANYTNIWAGAVTPSAANFIMQFSNSGSTVYFNGTGSQYFTINNQGQTVLTDGQWRPYYDNDLALGHPSYGFKRLYLYDLFLKSGSVIKGTTVDAESFSIQAYDTDLVGYQDVITFTNGTTVKPLFPIGLEVGSGYSLNFGGSLGYLTYNGASGVLTIRAANTIDIYSDVEFNTTGNSIRGTTVDANSYSLQTYDVDGTAYVDMIEVINGNTPSMRFDNQPTASTADSIWASVNNVVTKIPLPAGGGDVSVSGTPVDNQIAVWTNSTTIEGPTGLEFSSSTLNITGTNAGNLDLEATAIAYASSPTLSFFKREVTNNWVQDGGEIANIEFNGYHENSSDYELGAEIEVLAAEDWDNTNDGAGTFIQFATVDPEIASYNLVNKFYIGGGQYVAGGTQNGKFTFQAANANHASLRINEASVEPTSPYDGDIWVTTTNIYARINGVSESLIGGGSSSGSSGYVQYSDGSGGFNAEVAFQYSAANNNLTVVEIDADDLEFDSGDDSETSYSGVTSRFVGSGTLTLGNVVYISGNDQLADADADAATTMHAIGIVVNVADDKILTHGYYTKVSGWSWTAGDLIYVSTTAGGVTNVAPSGTGDQVQVIGVAVDSDTVFFTFDNTVIEI